MTKYGKRRVSLVMITLSVERLRFHLIGSNTGSDNNRQRLVIILHHLILESHKNHKVQKSKDHVSSYRKILRSSIRVLVNQDYLTWQNCRGANIHKGMKTKQNLQMRIPEALNLLWIKMLIQNLNTLQEWTYGDYLITETKMQDWDLGNQQQPITAVSWFEEHSHQNE